MSTTMPIPPILYQGFPTHSFDLLQQLCWYYTSNYVQTGCLGCKPSQATKLIFLEEVLPQYWDLYRMQGTAYKEKYCIYFTLQMQWCQRKGQMFYVSPTDCVFCLFICFVCNLFFNFILYIMLPLSSLMTENYFWTSGLRLLTTDWQNHFFHLTSLTSLTRTIYYFLGNRPKSPRFA